MNAKQHMTLIEDGAGYAAYADRIGHILIERVSDGADVYLQGDDAAAWRAEHERAETAAALPGARDWAYFMDALCGEYFTVEN
ncbi:MAG: hypothetical protein ACYYKD_09435 [Rhodospirillales bacterium]